MAENLNLKTVETVDTRPFRKLVMTIGELPTSFIESMTYYELLAWFTNYLETVIIPTVNNNGEAVEELQQKYIELKNNTEQEIDDFENEITTAFNTLKDFVDNYFDNLDVQEEINNKLDQMAEDGVLQEIIYQFLQSNVAWAFDTIASMKQATNLIDGSYAHTLGYHAINDGGGALYKIHQNTPSSYYETLNNGLYAELVIQPETNVRQFGAKGDDNNDDTTAFTNFINFCNTHSHNIIIPVGKYRIYNDLPQLDRGVSIVGQLGSNAVQGTSNYKSLILDYRNSNNYLIEYNANSTLGDSGNSIYNMSFSNPSGNTLKCIKFDHGGYKSEISNVMFSRYQQAIYIYRTHATRLNNVNCIRCGDMIDNGTYYAIEVDSTADVVMDHCMIEHSRFMLYSHGTSNFVLVNSYFEIGEADGYKGNSPVNTNGGTITNNFFCTRKVESIANDINDTIANVYYMVTLRSETIFTNNRFTIGSVSDANDGSNKQQGKFLTTNERNVLTIVDNQFNYVAFDTPGIYLQGSVITFNDNKLRIILEDEPSDSLASLYPIFVNRTLKSSNNRYTVDTSKTSKNQYSYLPKIANYNFIDYTLISTYSSGAGDDIHQYNYPRLFSKKPTLCIQGDAGLFRLVIRNVQSNGIWYEGIIRYDISGSSTTIDVRETLINKLSSLTINFIKVSSEKLIIQIPSTANYDMIMQAEDNMRRGFAYTSDLDEITEGIIHTIST